MSHLIGVLVCRVPTPAPQIELLYRNMESKYHHSLMQHFVLIVPDEGEHSAHSVLLCKDSFVAVFYFNVSIW